MRATIRLSMRRPRSCAASPGRAGRRHRHASKSFRFGDVEYRPRAVRGRGLHRDPAARSGAGCRHRAAWSTLPWHLMVLMEEAVEPRLGGVLASRGARRGVEWLDLVRSDEMNRRWPRWSTVRAGSGYRPDQLRGAGRARRMRASGGPRSRPSTGSRPIPGDQRAVPAQGLVAGQRHARSVPRPELPAGRRLVRRLRHSAPGLHHQSRAQRRVGSGCSATSSSAKHMRSYDIVRKPLTSIAPTCQARGAGMPLYRDRRRGPSRVGRPGRCRQRKQASHRARR